MTDRRSAPLSLRKLPKQARSNGLVEAILDAAVQVLAREGAPRFTAARVAEKAGVSVGSLYQYFPNKAAILFRLQSDEWRRTAGQLRALLEDARRPPLDRLRRVVHAFIRSECEEAALRGALADAAPLYRDAPEAHEARASGSGIIRAFMAEALPGVPEGERIVAGELIETTLSRVGKHLSKEAQPAAELDSYADALADMFCAYLDRLGAGKPEGGRGERARRD